MTVQIQDRLFNSFNLLSKSRGETAETTSPDLIRAMSTELFLDFLGIRMDSRKAEGMRFTINLITPDNGEKFAIELENATLTNIKGFLARNPDLTLTLNRSDIEQTMMGVKTLEAQIKDGTAKPEGDVGILAKLAATMWILTRALKSCLAQNLWLQMCQRPTLTRSNLASQVTDP